MWEECKILTNGIFITLYRMFRIVTIFWSCALLHKPLCRTGPTAWFTVLSSSRVFYCRILKYFIKLCAFCHSDVLHNRYRPTQTFEILIFTGLVQQLCHIHISVRVMMDCQMGGACNKHWRHKKYLQNISRNSWREETTVGRLACEDSIMEDT